MEVDSLAGAAPSADVLDQAALYRKVTWRIVPLIIACFIVGYLDRVNISFAKLQMQSQLGLSEAAYGLGASIFFIGYLLFEIPSNAILVRTGARRWIARIMITWGITSAAMMFVRTENWFYILRFLLGALEAGFVPGVLYFYTQWFPAARRGRMNNLFFGSIALCGVIGGPISGGILKYLDGVHGMPGWQWLFLIEGIPSVLLGLLVLTVLDDRIEDARWLNVAEKIALATAIARDPKVDSTHSFVVALKSPLIYLFSLIYFGLCMGIYGFLFWMPQLIKTAGTSDPLLIGLITMLPYISAIIGTVLIGRNSDRTGERRWHLSGCVFAGMIGYALCATYASSTVLLVAGLSIAATGIIASLGIFWMFPARVLSGLAAAAGLALINSVGQVGGVVAPYMVGKVKDVTGSASMGLYVIALACGATAVLVAWVLPHRIGFRDARAHGGASKDIIGTMMCGATHMKSDHDTHAEFDHFPAQPEAVAPADGTGRSGFAAGGGETGRAHPAGRKQGAHRDRDDIRRAPVPADQPWPGRHAGRALRDPVRAPDLHRYRPFARGVGRGHDGLRWPRGCRCDHARRAARDRCDFAGDRDASRHVGGDRGGHQRYAARPDRPGAARSRGVPYQRQRIP
jgi:MFS family permease